MTQEMTTFENPLDEVYEGSRNKLAPTEPSMESILGEEDENNDDIGVLTIAKFGVNLTKGTLGTLHTLAPVGGSPRAANKVSRDELRKLFDQIDVDGGGTLDPPELRELVHGLGVHLTEADLTTTILEMLSPVSCICTEPLIPNRPLLIHDT